jgi:hypothetical protein
LADSPILDSFVINRFFMAIIYLNSEISHLVVIEEGANAGVQVEAVAFRYPNLYYPLYLLIQHPAQHG